MLNIDFTFAKYKELCETIVESEYTTLTFTQYFSLKNIPEKFIILRHDVERQIEHALRMAKIENDLGIISTYYFRMKEDVFKPEIIKEVADMGHEIGYHYEVLDKAKGDYERAIEIFEEELKKFRAICEVKTICMHGNPFSKWVNKDLWTKYNFEIFGIIGEPYLSMDYINVLYLTDTGRRWNSKFSVKDVVDANLKSRWNDNIGRWLKELVWQNIKNIGKAGIVWHRKTKEKHETLL